MTVAYGKRTIVSSALILWLAVALIAPTQVRADGSRPNILVLIADDWSWPHASILGDAHVKTPTFDRLAKQGVLFENAFVSSPSCTPSRMAIATGQWHWRLADAANLGGSLANNVPVYADLLHSAGYQTGFARKGAQPSKHRFRGNDPFGARFASFDKFLEANQGEPFCFWYGAGEPHRPYAYGAGAAAGLNPKQITPPPFLPNDPVVRNDLADYYERVQRFDRDAGQIVDRLKERRLLENTLIVMTSDNGMPFPRCKATLYDSGVRVPLVVHWPEGLVGGRTVSEFVSLCDLAPTFLNAAKVAIPPSMTGQDLAPILRPQPNGRVNADRNHVLMGMERHVFANPSRAIRTARYLYIRNLEPAQWRTGLTKDNMPEYDFRTRHWPSDIAAFSFNIDPSPTKQLLWRRRKQEALKTIAERAFGKRPREELYDLQADPFQLNNIAAAPDLQEIKARLRATLQRELAGSGDPRFRKESK